MKTIRRKDAGFLGIMLAGVALIGLCLCPAAALARPSLLDLDNDILRLPSR